MMADVAWLIDCDERWLAGAVPYRDFLEINPPASLLLYLPAVAFARTLGLAFGSRRVGASASLSQARRSAVSARDSARVARASGRASSLTAIVALVVLPGESFCERDHLAAVFGVPFLAATLGARRARRRRRVALALLAGVGAGLMAAIKPPYALIGVLLALYVDGARRLAGGAARPGILRRGGGRRSPISPASASLFPELCRARAAARRRRLRAVARKPDDAARLVRRARRSG